jgi:hypothetical protein
MFILFLVYYSDSWRDCVPDSSSASQASAFLSHLVKVAYDSDSTILRENIRSINCLIRIWLPTNSTHDNVFLNIDLEPVVSLLKTEAAPTGGAHGRSSSRGTEGIKRRLAGLDLLKAFTDCSYKPLGDTSSSLNISKEIKQCMIQCILFPRKEVMTGGALIAGCLLKLISTYTTSSSKSSSSSAAVSSVSTTIDSFISDIETALFTRLAEKNGWNNVATCLKAITSSFPTFLRREMFMKITQWFRKMSPRFVYLRIRISCIIVALNFKFSYCTFFIILSF